MHSEIPLLICMPFAIILLMIAVMPLAFPHFWESNKNKAILSAIVSIPVLPGIKLLFFALVKCFSLLKHPAVAVSEFNKGVPGIRFKNKKYF